MVRAFVRFNRKREEEEKKVPPNSVDSYTGTTRRVLHLPISRKMRSNVRRYNSQGTQSRDVGNDLLGAIAPEPDDGHGEAEGGQASLDHVAPRKALDLDPDLLTVDVLDVLLAGGLAGDVAEDLVAGLHPAGGRLLLGGPLAGGGGGGLGQEARGGGGEDGEQRGVEQVRVARGARGEDEGEEEWRRGERGEGAERAGEGVGERGDGLRGRGRGREAQERGEGDGRDGVRDALELGRCQQAAPETETETAGGEEGGTFTARDAHSRSHAAPGPARVQQKLGKEANVPSASRETRSPRT